MSANVENLSQINEEFIDNLPSIDYKIIQKYQKLISKSIAKEAKIIGIQEARRNANLKFGKGWRERLEVKSIGGESYKMSCY